MSNPIPLPDGFTRQDVINGLRSIYQDLVAFEKEKDSTFVGYPDVERVLDHIEQYGLPPKEPASSSVLSVSSVVKTKGAL